MISSHKINVAPNTTKQVTVITLTYFNFTADGAAGKAIGTGHEFCVLYG